MHTGVNLILGIYSLAAQLSQLLWILPQAVASVLYSYASSSSQEEAINYTVQLKQLSFYGTLVFGLAGLVLAYFFISVLYGNEFTGAFHLMTIFVIGVIPFSIPQCWQVFLLQEGILKSVLLFL